MDWTSEVEEVRKNIKFPLTPHRGIPNVPARLKTGGSSVIASILETKFKSRSERTGGMTFFSSSMARKVRAHVAQLVEHILGKDEVTSSNLVMGSRISNQQ